LEKSVNAAGLFFPRQSNDPLIQPKKIVEAPVA
jgi:hypothetical protein